MSLGARDGVSGLGFVMGRGCRCEPGRVGMRLLLTGPRAVETCAATAGSVCRMPHNRVGFKRTAAGLSVFLGVPGADVSRKSHGCTPGLAGACHLELHR